MNEVYPESIEDWFKWLELNDGIEKEVWLRIYKKGSKHNTISYEDALNTALCFGWVDVLVKNRDEESYFRVFKKKNAKGTWSDKNKERVEKLIELGLMQKSGLEIVKKAKQNGKWDEVRFANLDEKDEIMFINKLQENTLAYAFYLNLSKSHQGHYVNWISSAKKEETKLRRINKAIIMLQESKKFTG